MKNTNWLLLAGALALAGCNSGTTDTPDAPVAPTDAPLVCPRSMVPDPDTQTLPCCYRDSQASNLDQPEMRLRYISITSPADPSPLSGALVGDVLNDALQRETFNWLFRTTGASVDGPIDIETGFGWRELDGTYTFSDGSRPLDMPSWLPVHIAATLTGETVTSDPVFDALTIPIFDEAGTTVQIELVLHSTQILSVTMSENRSCIGSYMRGGVFDTAGTLGGYILVSEAQAGVIMVGSLNASLCGVVAGNLLDPAYCTDVAQADWMAPPDSMCDTTTGECHRNGEAGVTCDPSTCNAWYLQADFAAVGVEIN